MKAFTFASVATLFAGLTMAHPVDLAARSSPLSDVDVNVLQFALTLEHLENEFYRSAFRTFTLQQFLDAGFSQEFFLNLQFIASDENTHVQILEQTILGAGHQPVLPCQYKFPVTDIKSFVTLSAVLESIGTSAYLGAAPFIDSKQILGVAASILGVEAFHTSIQRVSIGAIGAPDPFTTPLGANAIFSLASQFIVSCPAQNPPLPFKAFPGLQVQNAQSCLGENTFAGQAVSSQNVSSANSSIADAAAAAATTTTATDTAAATTTTTATEAAAETTSAETTSAESAAATTEAAAATTTAEGAAASTTTSEAAAVETAPAKRGLSARQNSLSCQAPFAGSSLALAPDFNASPFSFGGNVVQIFVTFVSGLNIVSVAAQIQGGGALQVVIPSVISGQAFIFITINNVSGGRISDSDVLFGPAIMEVAPALPTLQI